MRSGEVLRRRSSRGVGSDQLLAHQHAASSAADATSAAAAAGFGAGNSVLVVDSFNEAEGLRAVIRRGIPRVKKSAWWVHLFSRYASVSKKSKF